MWKHCTFLLASLHGSQATVTFDLRDFDLSLMLRIDADLLDAMSTFRMADMLRVTVTHHHVLNHFDRSISHRDLFSAAPITLFYFSDAGNEFLLSPPRVGPLSVFRFFADRRQDGSCSGFPFLPSPLQLPHLSSLLPPLWCPRLRDFQRHIGDQCTHPTSLLRSFTPHCRPA